jgi:hypothetical protein
MTENQQNTQDHLAVAILEIGYFHTTAESGYKTKFVDFRFSQPGVDRSLKQLTKRLLSAPSEIRSGKYQLLVVRSLGRYVFRRDTKFIINLIRYILRSYIIYCAKLAKRNGLRVAVNDTNDDAYLDRQDLRLLDICDKYFQRELPSNLYKFFAKTDSFHLEGCLTAESGIHHERCAKLRPFPIGITSTHDTPNRIDREPRFAKEFDAAAKKYDVFFAGNTTHSYPRRHGIQQLRLMEREGYRVLILENQVPVQEFWDLMSQSWLTWSPEGLGWDCYRHYEAALAKSVPLMNQSPNLRYKPLIHGQHAVFYDIIDGGLADAAKAALGDKASLARMAVAAREHVLEYHVPAKRAEYLIRETLGTA